MRHKSYTHQYERLEKTAEELKNLFHYDHGYNEVAINRVIDQLDKLRAETKTISDLG